MSALNAVLLLLFGKSKFKTFFSNNGIKEEHYKEKLDEIGIQKLSLERWMVLKTHLNNSSNIGSIFSLQMFSVGIIAF